MREKVECQASIYNQLDVGSLSSLGLFVTTNLLVATSQRRYAIKPLLPSRRRRMLERQLRVASLLHFNDQRHTAFGTSEGKRFPHVLAGDWIHHLEVWIGPALDNSSSNLGLHVGIIEIDDRQGHSGIAARVFSL